MNKKSILLIFITLIYSCHQSKQATNSINKEFKIESSFLLFPVEDSAGEVKIRITLPDTKASEKYWIRLAQNKVDYWVKLNVGDYKGKNIQLNFENPGTASYGISRIKQSDKFDLEYNEKYRPDFHFTPEYAWMNDPNGMVYLQGEYHLFYQYNPYGNKWGNMHWGHAVSTDLTSWTYLPVALKPDSLGDIFSGSAVVDENNTAGFGKNALIAIYTANGKSQQQCIAYSTDRGRTFTKYKGNPVIANSAIRDFRDPKVSWNAQLRQWLMVLATGQTVTFFTSPDLKNWSMKSRFGDGIGSHAGVWECPDVFPLTYKGATKWVLLVSINPGSPNGGSATQYFIGNFDNAGFKADPLPYPLWVDYGRDDYAGVTWSNIPAADGRRIFAGWMSNWDYANDVPSRYFRNAITVPRQLTIVDNGQHPVLASYPVKEVELLRDDMNVVPDICVNKEFTINELLKNNDGSYEVLFNLQPNGSELFGFSLTNGDEELRFNFDTSTGFTSIDRSKSGLVGFSNRFELGMSAPLAAHPEYSIRLLIDKASAELFINRGETTMTTLFFPKNIMNRIRFFADRTINISNINIYNIK